MVDHKDHFVYPPTPGPDREPVRTWQDDFTREELRRIQMCREWLEEGIAPSVDARTREMVTVIAKMADLLDQGRLE